MNTYSEEPTDQFEGAENSSTDQVQPMMSRQTQLSSSSVTSLKSDKVFQTNETPKTSQFRKNRYWKKKSISKLRLALNNLYWFHFGLTLLFDLTSKVCKQVIAFPSFQLIINLFQPNACQTASTSHAHLHFCSSGDRGDLHSSVSHPAHTWSSYQSHC